MAAAADEATITSDPHEDRPLDSGHRLPGLDALLLLLSLAWGAGIASFSLTDNSFLTHLATGRLILERGSVPSSDPYTFTAAGTEWTVQSWLASVAYAAAERAGGVFGLRLLLIVVFLTAAGMLWGLTRPCHSLVPRIALLFGSLYIVTSLWGERPYMAGVIGLGVVWFALEGRIAPWILIPTFWLWANTHGSFPLGFGLAVVALIGARLDGDDLAGVRRVVMYSAVGMAAAMVGPLGPRVLLFPLTAITKADVLSEIVEWKPASYDTPAQRLFLVVVLVALAGLVRRPSWRLTLPTLVFVAAAIVAQRNIVMAVMVLVPVIASTTPRIGSMTIHQRPGLLRAYLAVGAVAFVGSVVYAVAVPFGALDHYPVRPLAWLGDEAIERPTATQDVVGNLLTALDGEDAAVFVDDRVDMLPADLVYDGLTLLRAEPDWEQVLDQYEIAYVVWERSKPLSSILATDARWRVEFSDTAWIVACRRGRSCG